MKRACVKLKSADPVEPTKAFCIYAPPEPASKLPSDAVEPCPAHSPGRGPGRTHPEEDSAYSSSVEPYPEEDPGPAQSGYTLCKGKRSFAFEDLYCSGQHHSVNQNRFINFVTHGFCLECQREYLGVSMQPEKAGKKLYEPQVQLPFEVLFCQRISHRRILTMPIIRTVNRCISSGNSSSTGRQN